MEREIRTFTAVLGVFLIFSIGSDINPETRKRHYDGFRAQDMIVPIPESEYVPPPPTPTPNVVRDAMADSITELDIEYEYTEIEYEYIGEYFVTAYCPWECGYNGENFPKGWYTASGEICHRAEYEDRLYEPTTCAVDPRIHHIGEDGDLFYIPEFDRVFIAEDTGAFSGYWLDLFYEDYYEMAAFPTGYYSVYSVEYVTRTVSTKENKE